MGRVKRGLTSKTKIRFSLTWLSIATWLGSILIFVLLLYIGTNKFQGTIDDTDFGRMGVFLALLVSTILIGVVAFLTAVVNITLNLLRRSKKKSQSKLSSTFRLLVSLTLFPLFFVHRYFKPFGFIRRLRKKGIGKVLHIKIGTPAKLLKQGVVWIFVFVTFWIWFIGYAGVALMVGSSVGLVGEPIPIAGTGSMYPTFPKGQGKTPQELAQEVVGYPGMRPYPNGLTLFDKRYFGHELDRGDIASFFNEKTVAITEEEYGLASGFVKRIIGLPGDVIEIREGLVYLNGEPLMEPYIARARSTFGGTFISECKKVEVPEGQLLVLGDNRTASQDSRFEELGLISYGDIDHVIPFNKQEGEFDKNWRDTSNDLSESAKIILDKDGFLRILNEKRKEAGVKPLEYNGKLEKSAERRGAIMLKHDDFSFEATRSGYTMARAMSEAGYWNPVWGEGPILGYFDENELIEYLFEFPESKKFYTGKDFQDIGVGIIEGDLNNCPTQVIVLHIAGYVPPNYSKEEIEGWKTTLSRLREVQPGWAEVKTWGDFYERNKKDVDRINEIMAMRINSISAIVAKMEKSQWLSQRETEYTYQDKELYEEQEEIATRLNSQ